MSPTIQERHRAAAEARDNEPYRPDPACVKCGNLAHRQEIIRTTGDGLSRFFDVQNKKFHVRICERCGYSEMYSASTTAASSVMDLLFGG